VTKEVMVGKEPVDTASGGTDREAKAKQETEQKKITRNKKEHS